MSLTEFTSADVWKKNLLSKGEGETWCRYRSYKKISEKKDKSKKNKCSNKMLRFTDEGSIIKESGLQ